MVDLRTTAHVYFVRQQAGVVELAPASDVPVLVERSIYCRANKWLLAEASSTMIDSYLVRTNKDGMFQVPPRQYDQVCTGGPVLFGTALVPGYRPVEGRVYFLHVTDPNNPVYGRVDRNNDVFLENAQPSANRLAELRYELSFSATVSSAMDRQANRAMRPEIESLLTKYSVDEYFDARVLRDGLQQLDTC
jgi:hypothetical protein